MVLTTYRHSVDAEKLWKELRKQGWKLVTTTEVIK